MSRLNGGGSALDRARLEAYIFLEGAYFALKTAKKLGALVAPGFFFVRWHSMYKIDTISA
jgi:hypothetical protein